MDKLIRKVTKETYFKEGHKAFQEILKITKHFKKNLDYKSLINEGRKY